MKLKDFLSAKRTASKFQTFVDISAYAKTRGYDISAESLRLCEKGDRIPNSDTRRILVEIYKLTPDEADTLNWLCASEILARDFPDYIAVSKQKTIAFSEALTQSLRYLPDDTKSKLKDTPWIKTQLT